MGGGGLSGIPNSVKEELDERKKKFYKANVTLESGEVFSRILETTNSDIDLDVNGEGIELLSEKIKLLVQDLHREIVYKVDNESDNLKHIVIKELPTKIYKEIESTQNCTKITLDEDLSFSPLDKKHIDNIDDKEYEELLNLIENEIKNKYNIKIDFDNINQGDMIRILNIIREIKDKDNSIDYFYNFMLKSYSSKNNPDISNFNIKDISSLLN